MPGERRAGASLTARRVAVAGLALLCLLVSMAGAPQLRWPDGATLAAALPRLDLAVSVRVTIEPGQMAQAVAGMVRR